MRKFIKTTILTMALAVALASVSHSILAQSYKCKGADGKIEYSDRPCAPDKDVLAKPQATTVSSKPATTPMLRLQTLFTDYEERLCEREKLSIEMDKANRSGDAVRAKEAWKPKQERLNFLNDTLIEFQDKAGKIIKVAGADSEESAALRKYQRRLKDCDKNKSVDKAAKDAKDAAKPGDAPETKPDAKTATTKPVDSKTSPAPQAPKAP